MPRKKRKFNEDNFIRDSFVAITYEMIENPAYKKLNGASLRALILFLQKVKTHHPIDRWEYQFAFTFTEAAKRGISNSSFERAVTQLIELGFIECTVKGGKRSDGLACSYYRLSKRWKDYGTPNFQKRWNGHCEAVHGR